MTLVVARTEKGRLAIAADTLVAEHGSALAMQSWVLKSRCVSRNICVSFSGSPELAAKAFHAFRTTFPNDAAFASTIAFFERSSAATGNDYIVAFDDPAKLVTIRDGRRTGSLSKTHWIGDKNAFERFREWEHRRGQTSLQGCAVQAALFADEMEGSPASDLYSTMRNIVEDRSISSVGGFVTVLSNRDFGFRFSVYSDVLFDWPVAFDKDGILQLTHKFDLGSSGENDRYSVNQISPGYYNMNAVAFYLLKGQILVLFYETADGGSACVTYSGIEPAAIAPALNEKLGLDFRAMCLVMSARQEFNRPFVRSKPDEGLAMGLYCEVNTMPKVPPLSAEI